MRNEVCHMPPSCIQTGFVVWRCRSALCWVLCSQSVSFGPCLQFFPHFSACVPCCPLPEELLWLWGRGPQPAQMCPYVPMDVFHTIKSSDLKAESRILMHEPIWGISLPSISDFFLRFAPQPFHRTNILCVGVLSGSNLLLLWKIYIFLISIFLNMACEKVFFIVYLHHSTSAEIILAKKEEVNFIVQLPIYFSSPQFHCTISAA